MNDLYNSILLQSNSNPNNNSNHQYNNTYEILVDMIFMRQEILVFGVIIDSY